MKTKHLLTIVLLLLTGRMVYAQTPVITSFSPSLGPPGTLVVIKGTNLGSASAVNIAGKPAVVVSNTTIKIVAMVMPGATGGGVSATTSGGTGNAAGSYTITNNSIPSLQSNRLSAGDVTGLGGQGCSVAISADGNTAIVGGYTDNSGTGAVWIYKLRGTSWVLQRAKLVGTGGVGASSQGYSVAISADGNTAMAGGHNDDSNKGAAWVFTRQADSTWAQQGSKIAGTSASGFFGSSVALSADGNTAVIGAYGDNSYMGSTSIFVRSGGTWTQQGPKLVGTGSVGTTINQGTKVAISADGNTVITGGIGDDSVKGAAWVFTRSGTTWTQQGGKLVPADGIGTVDFGLAVSLSAEGNTALIGGPGDDGTKGAGWIFKRNAGTWSQYGNKLTVTDAIGNPTLACSTALSADGNTVVLGGSFDNGQRGATWVFKQINDVYTQQSKLYSTDAIALAQQGTSVAITATGATIVVGAQKNKNGLGAAWAFSSVGPLITSISPAMGPVGTLVAINGTGMTGATACNIGGQPAIILSNTATKVVAMVMPGAATGQVSVTAGGGSNSAATNFTITDPAGTFVQQGSRLSSTDLIGNGEQGISVALSSDGKTAIVGGYADNNFVGCAWIYKQRNGAWVLQSGKLIGTGVTGATSYQGYAVALSADGNTALVGGYGDNSLQGAAWVYVRQPDSTWIQQGAKITGTGGVGNATFGYSVALSADGNKAIIGGYADNNNTGAVWFYNRSGSAWTQQGGKFVGTGAVGFAAQGARVAISADGNTALAGGLNDNSSKGAVWVYTFTGGNWAQQGAKLVAVGNTGNANFGSAVALNADGSTALMGGYGDSNTIGAAWVFNKINSKWAQVGTKLVPAGTVGNARIGTAVSISANGRTAVLGGAGDNNTRGAIWIYKLQNDGWIQQGDKLIGNDVVGFGQMGTSAAISGDGLTVMMGGPNHKTGKGASWIFTLAPSQPPVITAVSPASGPIGTLLSITGTNLGSATNVTIGGKVATIVSGTSTKVVAMVMPGAVNGPVNITTGSGTSPDMGNFNIVNTDNNPPVTQQGEVIYDLNLTGNAGFGTAIAVSADGNTAIMGGPLDGVNAGAWIYSKRNGIWVRRGSKLTGYNNGTTSLGCSVAISADGNTVIVGQRAYPVSGAAFVYTRQADSTYAMQGPLLQPAVNNAQIFFGTSVALSGDGNTAVIGSPSDNSGKGAVWVYTRSGNTWLQQIKLTGNDGVSQGLSVAISADGSTIMEGNTKYQSSGTGYVWFFSKSGLTWVQQGPRTTGTGGVGEPQIGSSVALSADGNTAIAGGLSDNNGIGASWIFTRSSGAWSQYGSKLVPSDPVAASNIGNSVSISADGKTAVMGGPNNITSGGIWVYKLLSGTWTQQGNKILGTSAAGGNINKWHQGAAVSISANGLSVLAGAPGFNHNEGAAFEFAATPIQQIQTINFARPFALTSTADETEATATATSGLPVTYTTSNPNIATVVNGRIRMVGRGTVTITANQTGNNEFKAALPVSHTLNVGRSLTPNSLGDVTGPAVDQALSPNGDGKNDVLAITNIEMYPDNKLSIVNTNGDRVFEGVGYNNRSKVFDGTSSLDSKKQKPGTYYYRLEYKDNGVLKSKTGYIVIKY